MNYILTEALKYKPIIYKHDAVKFAIPNEETVYDAVSNHVRPLIQDALDREDFEEVKELLRRRKFMNHHAPDDEYDGAVVRQIDRCYLILVACLDNRACVTSSDLLICHDR